MITPEGEVSTFAGKNSTGMVRICSQTNDTLAEKYIPSLTAMPIRDGM
jgi:hypothetical protein